jgi:hypothetical protein
MPWRRGLCTYIVHTIVYVCLLSYGSWDRIPPGYRVVVCNLKIQWTINYTKYEDARHTKKDIFNGWVQGCQMVYFQTENPNLSKFSRALDWKLLIYFCPFGVFYWHLVNFMTIWYIVCWFGTFFRFWYHVPRKIWQSWGWDHFSVPSDIEPAPSRPSLCFCFSWRFPENVCTKCWKMFRVNKNVDEFSESPTSSRVEIQPADKRRKLAGEKPSPWRQRNSRVESNNFAGVNA